MKVIALVVLLVAVVVAEEMKDLAVAESYPAPVHAAASHGQAYGAYGRRDAGYGAHGHGYHGDHGRYADRAHAAHGHHNIGAQRAHDAYGAHGSQYGKYRNVGAYAHNRGAGYEKAYAYDKKAGHHSIGSDYGAKHGQYGVHDRAAHHNVGAYARAGHDRHGSHDRYGGHGYGVQAHDSAAYGRHGSSHGQMLYHAAPAVHYQAAPSHVYGKY